ncbi:MAG: DinB family protein [Gemmatimonadota bacterium]
MDDAPTRHAVDEMMQILERTPATLRALLEDLPDDLLHADEGEGTFSPFSVLGHLIAGEKEDWIPRARRILDQGTARPFEPFDRFAHIEATRGRTPDDLLDEFARRRAESLDRLRAILADEPDLEARGVHPELGEVTLRELLATWVVHDLNHVGQIARVVARQFEDEVGPWRAYLPILSPRT